MKHFIKFIFKLIFSTLKKIIMFILSTVLMIALIFYFFNLVVTQKMEEIIPEKKFELKANSYIELSFPEGLREKSRGNQQFMNFFEEAPATLYSVIRSLENAKTDEKINGLYIDLDKIRLSAAHTEEIIEKIGDFKSSGKKVYAFGNFIHTGNVKFALIADETAMTPSHSTNFHLTGYSYATPYFKPLLDNLGVEFQVVHIGDYKTYGEHLVKDEMSMERKSEITRIYDKRYSELSNNIADKLNLNSFDITEDIFNGDYARNDAFDAKEKGIITSVEYKENFISKRDLKNRVSISKYQNYVPNKDSENKIALIYAEGNLIYGEAVNLSENVISPSVLIDEIDRALKNDSIKGIVLRVNSPGGVALSAEIISEKLAEAKSKKPIYISMGSSAASGGYYISANADKIFADKATITGSIGVVSMIFNLNEFFENLNINIESISKGKYSDLYSLQRALTEEELNLMLQTQLNIYDEFKQRIIDGRKIDPDSLEEIAQGKIWLGDEALKNGLIDQIGGLDTAIEELALSLSLPEYQVVEIVKPLDPKELFNKIAGRMTTNTFLNDLNTLDQNIEYIKSNHKQALTLMPYDLELK